MTKQQHSASSLSPSKLCRLLIIVFTLKLTVLGLLILEPVLPVMLAEDSVLFSLLSGKDAAGRSTAVAATGDSAGAPPALTPVLPDAAAAPASPSSAPSANQPGQVLPAIGGLSSGASPEAGNGTSTSEVRDALARRQEDLARKEQELRVLESELESRLEKMKMLENRLSTMIKDAEETNDAKFRHLVDVLSNMKAKQAAAVLETLDPKIAVRVLAGMRGRQAGEVLTFVRPEIAAKLTESLARMQLPLE